MGILTALMKNPIYIFGTIYILKFIYRYIMKQQTGQLAPASSAEEQGFASVAGDEDAEF